VLRYQVRYGVGAGELVTGWLQAARATARAIVKAARALMAGT
jgi:hypothetical protein